MREPTKWTSVRISEDTKARLEQLREIWTELGHLTKRGLGDEEVRSGGQSTRDAIGLDQVIRKLILMHADHVERALKANAKRRQERQKESNE